jgi:hypothetical protein
VKIRLTYRPPNKDLQSWELDPDDLDNLESETVEAVGGTQWDSYAQWFYLVTRGNTRAVRALLWMLLKRTDPLLDFNEVRFRTSDVELSDAEESEPVGKGEPDAEDTDSPSAPPDSPPDSES